MARKKAAPAGEQSAPQKATAEAKPSQAEAPVAHKKAGEAPEIQEPVAPTHPSLETCDNAAAGEDGLTSAPRQNKTKRGGAKNRKTGPSATGVEQQYPMVQTEEMQNVLAAAQTAAKAVTAAEGIRKKDAALKLSKVIKDGLRDVKPPKFQQVYRSKVDVVARIKEMERTGEAATPGGAIAVKELQEVLTMLQCQQGFSAFSQALQAMEPMVDEGLREARRAAGSEEQLRETLADCRKLAKAQKVAVESVDSSKLAANTVDVPGDIVARFALFKSQIEAQHGVLLETPTRGLGLRVIAESPEKLASAVKALKALNFSGSRTVECDDLTLRAIVRGGLKKTILEAHGVYLDVDDRGVLKKVTYLGASVPVTAAVRAVEVAVAEAQAAKAATAGRPKNDAEEVGMNGDLATAMIRKRRVQAIEGLSGCSVRVSGGQDGKEARVTLRGDVAAREKAKTLIQKWESENEVVVVACSKEVADQIAPRAAKGEGKGEGKGGPRKSRAAVRFLELVRHTDLCPLRIADGLKLVGEPDVIREAQGIVEEASQTEEWVKVDVDVLPVWSRENASLIETRSGARVRVVRKGGGKGKGSKGAGETGEPQATQAAGKSFGKSKGKGKGDAAAGRPNEAWVILEGSDSNKAKAKEHIQALYDREGTLVEVEVGDAALKAIRRTARQLEDDNNCRVSIISDRKVVKILGGADRGKTLAEQLKKQYSTFVEKVVKIKPGEAGLIIGYKGERKRTMESKSKASIDVGDTQVVIAGRPEAVERGLALVEAELAGSREKAKEGKGGGKNGSKGTSSSAGERPAHQEAVQKPAKGKGKGKKTVPGNLSSNAHFPTLGAPKGEQDDVEEEGRSENPAQEDPTDNAAPDQKNEVVSPEGGQSGDAAAVELEIPSVKFDEKKEKTLKKVVKAGGKRGVEIEGAADMGGLHAFSTFIEEPNGDEWMLLEALKAMNIVCEPGEEERKGCSGHIAKSVFSTQAENKHMSYIVYVPRALSDKIDIEEWFAAVNTAVRGERVASARSMILGKVQNNPDEAKFVLKLKDEFQASSLQYLRSTGNFPSAAEDSDDDMVFGDDFDCDALEFDGAAEAADEEPVADDDGTETADQGVPQYFAEPEWTPQQEKRLKKVLKEGGKKGVEIEGAADMGGMSFFCTSVDEPNGDSKLLIATVSAMNAVVKPDDEERKGGSGHIGKFIQSASNSALAFMVYLPSPLKDKLELEKWFEAVSSTVGGSRVASCETAILGEVKGDPEAGKFTIKMKDEALQAAITFLKQGGNFPDESDDDDELVFGDDDFPCDQECEDADVAGDAHSSNGQAEVADLEQYWKQWRSDLQSVVSNLSGS